MINTNSDIGDSRFATLFIPIEKIYSLYIDSAGRFRYVGHRGITNTENQPLASGPIRINLSLIAWPSKEHQSLSAEFIFPGGRQLSNHYHSRLKRLDPINLILN
jgi:hypothetical protein